MLSIKGWQCLCVLAVIGCPVTVGRVAVWWVVVRVWGVELYSLSSSVAYKRGVLDSTRISFSLPLLCATSISIFLLRREFSYLRVSVSSTLRFLNSANSFYILACPSRMDTRSTWFMPASLDPTPASFTLTTLLWVETISKDSWITLVRC